MPELSVSAVLQSAALPALSRDAFAVFKTRLAALLGAVRERPEESEEYHKNNIADFFKKIGYEGKHYINTDERKDLVIRRGADPKSPIAVIIETKSPSNKAEMISAENFDAKAMRELVWYYLRERLAGGNVVDLARLVVSNGLEWFIFDARDFEKSFAEDKELVRKFSLFKDGAAGSAKTETFYRDIAAPAIRAAQERGLLRPIHLCLADFDAALTNTTLFSEDDENALLDLCRVFSPAFMLKLPVANDSNTLNEGFYEELLYIMGLCEKNGFIERIDPKHPKEGMLVENCIIALAEKRQVYDTENQEGIALDLCLTWINRVLFLKLLEGLILRYQNKSASDAYAFLNIKRIKDYRALERMFFQVLAVPEDKRERREDLAALGENVPFLNSSLFEKTDTEERYFSISDLDNTELALFSKTVLKDTRGNKSTGKMNALEYLFAFLDAYDFSSAPGEKLRDTNKAIINASVLGLIFEKINGYKDGSFFTPGFITSYICRETLRPAVVAKFNAAKGWHCADFSELYNALDGAPLDEANAILNTLTVCDPAVGSGHFLVSALNEIIAIKSELKILRGEDGRKLRDWTARVENDELVIRDDEGN
ncbi:MAG: hypothetical protein LBR16_02530, partial [Treponema sp.]|nr:hypothetical protein [Treponema sp.]